MRDETRIFKNTINLNNLFSYTKRLREINSLGASTNIVIAELGNKLSFSQLVGLCPSE